MSQSGIYSENKLVWWYARDQGLPRAPKQVQVIISDFCNQDCSFCAYRMSGYTSNELFIGNSRVASIGTNNPMRRIPTERAITLLDEIKASGALAVQFTGGGEPTIHPDCEDIFRHALDLGLRCSLVSNGIRWRKALMNDILPRFDWVRISIDAATEESYTKIRRCPDWHFKRVWDNVSNLVSRTKTHQPTIGLGFVVTPDSYTEILPFAERALKSGADNVRYSAMFSTEDEKPFLEIYDQIKWNLLKVRKLETDAFAVHDNFGSRFDDLKQHAPDYGSCAYQHYTTYIGGDLKVYRCCVLAYNKRGLVAGGDLKKRRFDEFWKSKERRDDMDALNPRGCERCQFNSKNRALLYVSGNTASDTTPRHMEWT